MTHTPVLHCFRNDDPDKAYHAMREGVRRLVRALPYVAGYITRGDQGYTHMVWDDNVTGDEVELERKDGRHLPTYDELLDAGMQIQDIDFDFKPSGCLTRELVPKEKEPALLMAFTELRGGLIAAFAPMHQMCDGIGQVILTHTWADLSAGNEPVYPLDPRAPLRRYESFREATGLEPSPHHKKAVTVDDDADIIRPAELERAAAEIPVSDKTTLLSRKMFTFSSESIEELRQVVGKDTGERPPYFLSVLAALFWTLITEIRSKRGAAIEMKKEDEEEASTSIMAVADARMVFTDVGKNYVGNFLSPAFTTDTCQNFTSPPADDVYPTSAPYPPALPRATRLVTDGLKNALNPFAIQPKLQAILNIPDARLLGLAAGNPMGANDILLTSWSVFEKYPTWGTDIGIPDCHRAQPTANTTQRSTFSYIVVLPRRRGSDGKNINEVFTCFEEADMRELEKHPMLTRWMYKEPPFAKPGRQVLPYMTPLTLEAEADHLSSKFYRAKL